MKKHLFIILILILFIAACGNNEPDESNAEEPIKEEEPKKEVDKKEEIEDQDEPLDEKIKIDKTIELNGATIVIQSLRVKEDSTQLYGYWNHNTEYDKAHLDLLVTTTIKQDDVELDILNKDKLLDQKKNSIDGSLDLKIGRIDESPITITFTANTDEREQETITIDIP